MPKYKLLPSGYDLLLSTFPNRIQSLHGCADIKTTKGDILVGTVEGNFTGVTESGDINVHIATADPVNIWSNNGKYCDYFSN